MHNEINKLALFTSGRRIEEGDVSKVVSYARQANVFAMVDAVLEGKIGLAEKLLCQLLEAGATPPYILVMLSRQIRLMVRVKALRSQGKSETEIQRRLGLASDFVFRKTLDQAKRYPLALIREVYRHLLEADLAIKTGRYDGELALNILVARLCTS
jgi:DNA polymerase-3 subunit delta